MATKGRRLSDTRHSLESHLKILSSLLNIRNQVQSDIESSEIAGKRVAALERTRNEDKSRSLHEFNKTQIDRFRKTLNDSREADSIVPTNQLNRIASLEKAKAMANSLSRKYRPGEKSMDSHPSEPIKPKLVGSEPSTAASSRKSLSVVPRETQKAKPRPATRPLPKQPDSEPANDTSNQGFKFITVPDRFQILPDDQENIRDFVNRVTKADEETLSEHLSDVRRSIQGIKEIETASVTFSERRDPSRAIERRRAALAALKLRYGNN